MKAILEFNLDEPEDRDAHKRAVNATDMYLVVFNFVEYLRKQIKYEEMPEGYRKAMIEARGQLHILMEDYNISLSDLK